LCFLSGPGAPGSVRSLDANPGSIRGHAAALILRNHRHFAVGLASGFYDDFHVLAQGGEEVHEALDGKGAAAVAHQCRNVRLPDAENLSGFRLLEAASFDQPVDCKVSLALNRSCFG
jgi:hypothetical protein